MKQLVLKEARSLAFAACMVLVWIGVDWGLNLVTEFPDELSLAKELNHDNRLVQLLVLFIAGVAIGLGLLVREQDEGTMTFLDALPVRREQVFVVKVGLAWGLLCLLPLNWLGQHMLFHWLSRGSLAPGFHWDLLLTGFWLNCVMALVFLAMGLAVSFLRRLAYVALGLWACLLLALRITRLAEATRLNPFTITKAVYDGQEWLVPWEHLTVQLLVGALCLLLALRSFQGMGDRASRLAAALTRHRQTVAIAMTGIGFVVVLGFGSIIVSTRQEREERAQTADAGSLERTTRVTKARHDFTHRNAQSDLAEEVINNSEAVRDQLEQFLGVTVTTRVAVDMTGSLERHAGRAYWKKLRMNLTGGPRDQAVFAHELTHVLLDQAARGRLDDSFNSIRFFHEGLATFVEVHWFPLPEGGDMAAAYRHAAVARSWHAVRFEELVDDARLSRRLDHNLVYPLGAVFVDALVRRHGTNAPGRVAAAFGRPDAPKRLAKMELWTDTLQACGYNLADVVADFYALLDQAVVRERQFLADLPRLQGAVELAGDHIVIRAVRKGAATAAPLVCRVRQRDDSNPQLDLKFHASGQDEFHVPRNLLSERSFWYQLGVKLPSVNQVIYEPWVEARLSR